jgi:DNA-binding transcriptional LysR family regulator
MPHPLVSLPPLDALRGFVAAARRLSITAAAEDLCLTQSAVSRQIQALEERLGTRLFTRRNRSIALTAAGEQLFRLASPWMDRLGELAELLRSERRARPVTVSASVGVAALWILPRLGAFLGAHPEIDVRVAATNRVMDLAQEDVDLAIRYSPTTPALGHAIRLFEEDVVPVASPAVAARAFASDAGLLGQVLLDLDDRRRSWLHWAQWLDHFGLVRKPRGTLQFNHYDQLIQAAVEGHGVALGRVPLILPLLKDGRLVAQHARRRAVPDYSYWLLQADPAPRAEVAVFRDWLAAQLAATSQELAQALPGAARQAGH